MRRWKNEILSQKKKDYEQKLQLAESKRKAHLRTIVKKAHEEENKVNEIAFIMTLEAQNKRAEMKSKHEVYEARKQELEVSWRRIVSTTSKNLSLFGSILNWVMYISSVPPLSII